MHCVVMIGFRFFRIYFSALDLKHFLSPQNYVENKNIFPAGRPEGIALVWLEMAGQFNGDDMKANREAHMKAAR